MHSKTAVDRCNGVQRLNTHWYLRAVLARLLVLLFDPKRHLVSWDGKKATPRDEEYDECLHHTTGNVPVTPQGLNLNGKCGQRMRSVWQHF